MSLSRDYDDETDFQPTKHRERKPSKFSMRLKVVVFDIKSGKQIREHETGWNAGSRQWFSALVLWAAKNGKSIELFNVKDDNG